jgi:hypothetical protein
MGKGQEGLQRATSFVCFSMHEERLSDITVLYLGMLSEFHDSVIKVVLLCPQVSK